MFFWAAAKWRTERSCYLITRTERNENGVNCGISYPVIRYQQWIADDQMTDTGVNSFLIPFLFGFFNYQFRLVLRPIAAQNENEFRSSFCLRSKSQGQIDRSSFLFPILRTEFIKRVQPYPAWDGTQPIQKGLDLDFAFWVS